MKKDEPSPSGLRNPGKKNCPQLYHCRKARTQHLKGQTKYLACLPSLNLSICKVAVMVLLHRGVVGIHCDHVCKTLSTVPDTGQSSSVTLIRMTSRCQIMIPSVPDSALRSKPTSASGSSRLPPPLPCQVRPPVIPGVGQLWPESTHPCFCVEHSHTHPLTYSVAAFTLPWQSSVVGTKTLWLAKPKIVPLHPHGSLPFPTAPPPWPSVACASLAPRLKAL